MRILAKVGAALQRLFGDCAREAAVESGVVERKRLAGGRGDGELGVEVGDRGGVDRRRIGRHRERHIDVAALSFWAFCKTPRRPMKNWRRWRSNAALRSRRKRLNSGTRHGWLTF